MAAKDSLIVILETVDSLLEGESPNLLFHLAWLAGISMPHAVAVMEALPRRTLQGIPHSDFAWWLSVCRPELRIPLQSLAVRRDAGPEHSEAPPTNCRELLCARDHIWKAGTAIIERQHEGEVKLRLERRRRSRSR